MMQLCTKSYTKLIATLWSFTILITINCLNAAAQEPTYNFEHLTTDDGLSQSSVFALTRDKTGFVWIGTREGLNRYDAHRLKVYKHRPGDAGSLPGNTISSLLTDSRGTVWVGTNAGLATYQPEKDAFTLIAGLTDTTAKPSSVAQITCLLEDQQGQIWVGTRHGLLLLTAGASRQCIWLSKHGKDTNPSGTSEIRSLALDGQGTVWVGMAQGFARVEKRPRHPYRFITHYPRKADSLYQNSGNTVNTLADDRQGRLWLGTEKSGLLCFDRQTGRFLPWAAQHAPELTSGSVRTIAVDRKGTLWVGTINGLHLIDPLMNVVVLLKNNPAQATSLSDNSIKSIFIDSFGSCWIGTYYGGVDAYSPLAKPFGYLRLEGTKPVPFKIASALVIDRANRRWIGTEDKGLFLTDEQHRIIRHYDQDARNPNALTSNKVKCLLPDGDTGLWIGTLNGLNYLDTSTDKVTRYLHQPGNPASLPDDRVYDLKKDHAGTLWVANYTGGLCRFNPRTRAFERVVYQPAGPSSSSPNTCLFGDSQQRLWVGSQTGLYCRLPGNTRFRSYRHDPNDPGSLSGDYIICLFEDSHHRIWAGTRYSGLNRFVPATNSFQRITVADGLPSNTVVSIQEDQRGFLWLGTEKGLSKLDPERRTCVNYDRTDGLICREFLTSSSLRDARGTLYFGGYNGVVVFNPDSIQPNTYNVALAYTDVRVFNKLVPVDSAAGLPQHISATRQITFDHTQNVFSVEFAALNFINPGKNRYAYKLAGFDTQWNYVTEPVATYMNLGAGQYTLLVKGANNSGVWSTEPLALSITVLPPPWQSGWAYALYALTLGGLLYAWMRFNQSRLTLAHALELEHLDKERQRDLNDAKLAFFADVAHDIRTPLTLIVSPVETLMERYPGDSFVQRQLALVSANTTRLLQLLNQLLDFHKQETGQVPLHPTEGDIVPFAADLTESFRSYAYSQQIALYFDSDEPHIRCDFDPDELAKVLTNLLANALKFTPVNGVVRVGVGGPADGSDRVVLTVVDTGKGIAPAELPWIFGRFYQSGPVPHRQAGFGLGLALAKGIVDRHGGTLSVESREAQLAEAGFTQFTVSLPCHQPHTLLAAPAPERAPVPFLAPLPLADDTAPKPIPGDPQPALLLVEDNEAVRQHLKSLFVGTCTVQEAEDGEQGWAIASTALPDLIISDVAMPKLGGISLTQRLKQDERTRHIPVILLTAKGSMDSQVSGLSSGADDYMVKPFHPAVLRLKVQNLLLLRERIREKYRRIVTLTPNPDVIDDPDAAFLQRLMAILEPNLANADFNVSTLTDAIGMSRPVLFRKIKMLTGLSVVELIRSLRMKKAQQLLSQKGMTVAEVAYSVGFSDPKYFSRQFRMEFGQSPTEFADSPTGSEIPG